MKGRKVIIPPIGFYPLRDYRGKTGSFVHQKASVRIYKRESNPLATAAAAAATVVRGICSCRYCFSTISCAFFSTPCPWRWRQAPLNCRCRNHFSNFSTKMALILQFMPPLSQLLVTLGTSLSKLSILYVSVWFIIFFFPLSFFVYYFSGLNFNWATVTARRFDFEIAKVELKYVSEIIDSRCWSACCFFWSWERVQFDFDTLMLTSVLGFCGFRRIWLIVLFFIKVETRM